MMTKIDDLAFEIEGDKVTLEQDAGCGEVHMVTLHAIHLRHLAESMGMVKTVEASGAELMRDMARYQRALLMLRDQAEHLYSMMVDLVNCGHNDIGVELAKATALADFASHICNEFEDSYSDRKSENEGQPKSAQEKGPAKQQTLALEVRQ